MSDTTNIQWTDATFNPWIGCTKVSAGCKHCYAENTTRARVLRHRGHETWGKGAPRSRTSAATWKKPVQWNKEALECGGMTPLSGGEARLAGAAAQDSPSRQVATSQSAVMPAHSIVRVFPSLCDWLDAEVPIEWLADFLKLIHDTPNLTWQLLTKRPENWYKRVSDALIVANGGDPKDKDYFVKHGEDFPKNDFAHWLNNWTGGEAPKHIHIGVSCEDQPNADKRITELLKIPAALRFLSLEPLLGPIDFGNVCAWQISDTGMLPEGSKPKLDLDWVIVGGESGPGARPCNIEWIRSIVKQCQAAGVDVFVKQLGSRPFRYSDNPKDGTRYWIMLKDPKGGDMTEWPADLRVREFPSAASRAEA